MASEKKRFVLLVDFEAYDKFKKLAELETRTAGNLAVKLILDYIKQNQQKL